MSRCSAQVQAAVSMNSAALSAVGCKDVGSNPGIWEFIPGKKRRAPLRPDPFFSRVAQPRSWPEMEEGFSFDRPSVFALTLMKDSPWSTQGTSPKNSWRQFCSSLSLMFYDILCMKISHLAQKPKQTLLENKSSLFCVICVKVPLKRGIAISD